MEQVDYQNLSELYASFLVAVGGVSITALTLVLSLGSESAGRTSRAFLVSALVVATVSCFIGSHMMAETSAFISYSKGAPTGERLFLLASTNIFVAVALVLFALMLLPTSTGNIDVTTMTPISVLVFWLVVIGVCCWLVIASINRMPAPGSHLTILFLAFVVVAWCICLCFFLKKYLLWASFIPIIILTVALQLYFALTFHDGGKVHARDIRIFSSIISISYISLLVASIKTTGRDVAASIKAARVGEANNVEY